MTESTPKEIYERAKFLEEVITQKIKLEERERIKKELLAKIDTLLIPLRKRKESYDREEQRYWAGIYNELCGRIDGLETARAEIEKM